MCYHTKHIIILDQGCKEQVRTCPTCGAYHLNLLVKDSLVPETLADVLMPQPMKAQKEKQKSQVVLEG
jgi:hypothetical protein